MSEQRVQRVKFATCLQALPLWVLAFQVAGCAINPPTRATVVEAGTAVREIPASPPDAEGRQLENAPHLMDSAMMEELRARVERFKGLDDQSIMRTMDFMGPNYTWYLSNQSLRGDIGVLILTHGFSEHGDR